MRSAELSVSRQTTSSRQSPVRSAVSAGVDLVPLFELTPLAVSRRLVAPALHLSMWFESRSSRVSSASHQITKFCDVGLVPRFVLLVADKRPSTLEDHISA